MSSILINSVEVNILGEVNLRKVFVEDFKSLPNLPEENIIYCLLNLINGKCYIGQAKFLWERILLRKETSHFNRFKDYCINNYTHTFLYNALRKYGCRNFNLYILEELDLPTQLNDREIYWIEKLHTCRFDPLFHGYNMTWGGDNCDHLNSEEGLKYRAELYGGDIMGQCHTEEAMTKSINTRITKYGDVFPKCHTREILEKVWNTNAQKYNGDICGQLRTESAMLNFHKSLIFNQINYCLSEIRKDSIITWEIYWHDIPYEGYSAYNHVNKVLKYINELRLDERWTPEMENIFSKPESNPSKYGLL